MSKCCNSPSLTFVLLLLYAVPLGLAGEISMIWFKFLITVKAVWSGWVSTKCRVQTFGHAPDQSSDIWDEWFRPAARTDNSLSLHPSVLGGGTRGQGGGGEALCQDGQEEQACVEQHSLQQRLWVPATGWVWADLQFQNLHLKVCLSKWAIFNADWLWNTSELVLHLFNLILLILK